MSWKDMNYVGHFFQCDGQPKLWEELTYRANYSLNVTK